MFFSFPVLPSRIACMELNERRVGARIAFVAALMSKKKFEEALTASMFVLGAVIILPMLVDAVLPTNLSAMLPLQKLPTLIGLLFVMPGLGFLVSRLSSRRR